MPDTVHMPFSRRRTKAQRFGRRGENIGCRLLQNIGMQILTRNFSGRSPFIGRPRQRAVGPVSVTGATTLPVLCMKLHTGVLRAPNGAYWSITAIGMHRKVAIPGSRNGSRMRSTSPRPWSGFSPGAALIPSGSASITSISTAAIFPIPVDSGRRYWRRHSIGNRRAYHRVDNVSWWDCVGISKRAATSLWHRWLSVSKS